MNTIADGISIELAGVAFDQWNLSVSLRQYTDGDVVGMALVGFRNVSGFRYLDEGEMLQYPFPNGPSCYYFEIEAAGWLDQEMKYGNIVHKTKEFLIATDNECICVLSPFEPVLLFQDVT